MLHNKYIALFYPHNEQANQVKHLLDGKNNQNFSHR